MAVNAYAYAYAYANANANANVNAAFLREYEIIGCYLSL